jgi:thymidine kinase
MGHLSLIIGCMFAQKTTELLRRIRRYKSIGYNVLVVNYIADTRYGRERVTSHDKDYEVAVQQSHLSSLESLIRSGIYQVLAIDEAQFFPDLYECITAWADSLPLHIVLAGLDGNSERQPFGDILRLIPHAEEVERVNALCAICKDGTTGIYSKYIGPSTSDMVIGGAELYRPVCRTHYLNM